MSKVNLHTLCISSSKSTFTPPTTEDLLYRINKTERLDTSSAFSSTAGKVRDRLWCDAQFSAEMHRHAVKEEKCVSISAVPYGPGDHFTKNHQLSKEKEPPHKTYHPHSSKLERDVEKTTTLLFHNESTSVSKHDGGFRTTAG